MTNPVFVFLKIGFTFSCTPPECMDHKKTWRINGIPFKDCEMKVIACRIMGLSCKDAADCICRGHNSVKGYLKQIYLRLDIDCVQQLVTKALDAGFDKEGNFNGRPVLTPDELERVAGYKKPPQ